jgi:hypothetical protein
MPYKRKMARATVMFPLGGLALSFCALLLWVSGVQLGWLDALVLALFAAGAGLSSAGYFAGQDLQTKRLGVIGIGLGGLGAVMLAILYLAG